MKTYSYPVFHALHESDISLSTPEQFIFQSSRKISALIGRIFNRDFILHAGEKCSFISPSTSKRLFDLFFGLLALTLLFPVLLLISVIIKLESKGDILYVPLREGKNNVLFPCFKFRTMYFDLCDNPYSGCRSTVKNDPRITRFGRFLRKYSLDELPQLINVIRGEMSLVGPRPHRVKLADDFRSLGLDYRVRHEVKPGLTGWAQINGWRGPTETLLQKTERVRHDLWYVKNQSLRLDMEIMWRTVIKGGILDPLS
jgi:putative colanic acid biosynthesis UDP-glucose lipid carrier transferase